MHPKRFYYPSCALLAVLLLSACTSGPRQDYAALAQQQRQQTTAWSESIAGEPALTLTSLIQAPEVEPLLAQAMAANPGLQQTLLTLKILASQRNQTGAERYPEIEAGFDANKTQESDPQYTGSISVSWEADIWRKLADDTLAADKDVAGQEALYQGARDTLAAEVISAWLGLIAQQKTIAIEQQRLRTLERNEQFILQRYRNGLGSLDDLDSARSSVASSSATLESYRESLAQQRRALQQLLGQTTPVEIALPGDFPSVLIPLAGLPEQTLQRRPDLQAAYLAIEAAELRTRVAYKDLLPSLSLDATLEDIADSARAALLSTPVWSLLGQLTAPLYQGGKLRAAAETAELETAFAYQAYRETLLTAVTEVDDALGLERSLARQQGHIETALKHARNSLSQYQQRYRTGLVDLLDLLAVQQQSFDLEAQLNNLVYERLANRIDLGLALGLGVTQ